MALCGTQGSLTRSTLLDIPEACVTHCGTESTFLDIPGDCVSLWGTETTFLDIPEDCVVLCGMNLDSATVVSLANTCTAMRTTFCTVLREMVQRVEGMKKEKEKEGEEKGKEKPNFSSGKRRRDDAAASHGHVDLFQ